MWGVSYFYGGIALKKFLQVGDVFKVEVGMRVQVSIPAKFVYANRTVDTLTETTINIGEILEGNVATDEHIDEILKATKDTISFRTGKKISAKEAQTIRTALKSIIPLSKAKEQFDTNKFVGEYVVIKTAETGGGTGHGPHDVYPDGHNVIAKKLKNGAYDPKGKTISFYQSGSFTCEVLPEAITFLRKMEMSFK